MRTLTIVGPGTWGTALAVQARRAGLDVQLLGRRARRLEAGFEVAALADTAPSGEAVLLVVKAAAVAAAMTALAPRLDPLVPLVICAKGLDDTGPRLLSEAVHAAAPAQVVMALSGPSFADEVVADHPTAVSLAARPVDLPRAEWLAHALHTPHFRPYLSDDPVGVQIGGAAKNVVAIACGMARGLGLGANAEAALATRGLAEMARLNAVMGGKPTSLMGLAGLGDLFLTCAGPHSRNFRFGMTVAEGRTADEAEAEVGLAEGRHTARLLPQLAHVRGVEMPIAEALDAVLAGRLELASAIDTLLERPLGREASV